MTTRVPENRKIAKRRPRAIALGTHFHAQHGTKTTPEFLLADGGASWSLFPSLVSLLSSGKV